jgi:hypothetical protein
VLFPITIVVANPVENEKSPNELWGFDSCEGRTGFLPDPSNNRPSFPSKNRLPQLNWKTGLKIGLTGFEPATS